MPVVSNLSNTLKLELFDAENKPFRDWLAGLSEDDIISYCEYKIFLRGIEYYDNQLVKNVIYSPEEETIKATVKGGEKYTVEISGHNDKILGSCSCPYEGVCKHIVAVLLFISENDLEESIEQPDYKNSDKKKTDNWNKYLLALDKSELIKLVDKYAPKSFRNEINNRYSDSSIALKSFKSVRKNIEEIFGDEELLFSPADFEASLLENLEKLRGFENQLTKEIEDLIIYIIENVNIAFGEGYLYIDGYPDDDYFESESFCEYVVEFGKRLPFNKKIEFLNHLDEALNNMSYSTFNDIGESFNKMISIEETDKLKQLISDSPEKFSSTFISRIYESIAALLSPDQKIKILGILKGKRLSYLLELCDLLISENRKDDAYKELKDLIESEQAVNNKKLISTFLDLSVELNKNISDAAIKAILRCPASEILDKIKSLPGADFPKCKVILRKKSPGEMLLYLEKEHLFNEALDLINEGRISEYEILNFYKRSKKYIVPEAEKYFINRINRNLPFTGDKYYMLIAESLEQLNKINPETVKKIVKEIRLNFKRRTKLMSLLGRY